MVISALKTSHAFDRKKTEEKDLEAFQDKEPNQMQVAFEESFLVCHKDITVRLKSKGMF